MTTETPNSTPTARHRVSAARGTLRLFLGTWLVLGALLYVPGCKSVDEHILQQRVEIHRTQAGLFTDPESLPPQVLDWDTAVDMLSSNVVLLTANEAVIQAETSVRRVFLDRLPQLSLQGFVEEGLTTLTALNSDTLFLNAYALFQVPGFIRLRMDYYAAALAHFKATQQYELSYREEVMHLHALFRQHQHLASRKVIDTLKLARRETTLLEREQARFRHSDAESALWLKLSTVLGKYDHWWIPETTGLPQFAYQSTPPWDDPYAFGALLTTLQAIELEGARLRALGITFQYWPQLSLRVNSPSLYLFDGGGGQNTRLTVDDLRLGASVWMNFDSNFSIRDQHREALRNTRLLKQTLYEDAQSRAKTILGANRALSLLETRRTTLTAMENLLLAARPAGSTRAYELQRTARIEWLNDQLAFEQEIDSLLAPLWIADEAWWRAHPHK